MVRRGFKREELELLEYQTQDPVAQENFDRIQTNLESQLFLRFEGDLIEFEALVPTAAALPYSFSYDHNLGYLPKDLWVTNSNESSSVTIDYDATTTTQFTVDISGVSNGSEDVTVTIRMFVGSFLDG